MRQNEFLESVRELGDFDSNEPTEEATVATLQTLTERLTPGQAPDLASGLPDELAGAVVEPETEGPSNFQPRSSSNESATANQRPIR